MMATVMTALKGNDTNLSSSQKEADWLIVGAGPAGIITIGILMDIGVDPKRIIWLDPQFEGGKNRTVLFPC